LIVATKGASARISGIGRASRRMNERLSTPDGLPLEPAPSLPEASVLLPDLGPALPPTVQQRLAVIQALLRYQGSDCYSEMQRQAAQTPSRYRDPAS